MNSPATCIIFLLSPTAISAVKNKTRTHIAHGLTPSIDPNINETTGNEYFDKSIVLFINGIFTFNSFCLVNPWIVHFSSPVHTLPFDDTWE